MNKKQLPVLLASFLLFGSSFAVSTAHAETASTAAVTMSKIGLVDVQEILRTAPQVNVIKEKLKSDFASRQSHLVAAQKTLQSNIEKLQADHDKMDRKAIDSLQKEIQRDIQAKQTEEMALQKDVFAAQDKALQGLLEEINNKAKEVAEQKQLELILLKNSVVYMKNTQDITSDVKKRMK